MCTRPCREVILNLAHVQHTLLIKMSQIVLKTELTIFVFVAEMLSIFSPPDFGIFLGLSFE